MSFTADAEPVNEELSALIDSTFRDYREGTIVNGTILEFLRLNLKMMRLK